MTTRSPRAGIRLLAALTQDPTGALMRALGTGAMAAVTCLLLGATLLRLRARLRAYIARRRIRQELLRQSRSAGRGRHA